MLILTKYHLSKRNADGNEQVGDDLPALFCLAITAGARDQSREGKEEGSAKGRRPLLPSLSADSEIHSYDCTSILVM